MENPNKIVLNKNPTIISQTVSINYGASRVVEASKKIKQYTLTYYNYLSDI